MYIFFCQAVKHDQSGESVWLCSMYKYATTFYSTNGNALSYGVFRDCVIHSAHDEQHARTL